MRSDGANQSLFIMRCKVTLKIDTIIHRFVQVYDLTYQERDKTSDNDMIIKILHADLSRRTLTIANCLY